MGLGEIISKIFGGKLKLPENINIKLSLLSNNKFSFNKNENTFYLDLSKLNAKQRELAKPLARKLLETNYTLLENESEGIIEDIKSKESEFKKITFFRDKLFAHDYAALEASVYIQKVFEEGSSISKFKTQLIQRYGNRGNTICKLYGTGYFKNFIKPLYEQMATEDGFSIEDFRRVFDKLVQEFPFAIFVNRTMGVDDILAVVKEKIRKNKKYGISNLNIHGINTQNVKNIREALKNLTEEGEIKIKSSIEKQHVILVSLEI